MACTRPPTNPSGSCRPTGGDPGARRASACRPDLHDTVRHKVEVLRRHCAGVGRDPDAAGLSRIKAMGAAIDASRPR